MCIAGLCLYAMPVTAPSPSLLPARVLRARLAAGLLCTRHLRTPCLHRLVGLTLWWGLLAAGPAARAEGVFDAVAPSVALIKTPRGSGTGFLYADQGETYLVTNEHITRSGFPVTAQLLNGQQLALQALEVADNLDLVRFKIGNAHLPALTAVRAGYSIEDEVLVFGNSGGQGVATLLRGKILGIGPDRVEVSAEFIQGNSGSPIVLRDGRVLAVATYVIRSDDPRDWVGRGTRFNQARRFGLRPDAAKWVTLKAADYSAQADALEDLRTFSEDLYGLAHATHGGPVALLAMRAYTYEGNVKRYRRWTGLCRLLAGEHEALKHWAEAAAAYQAPRAPAGRQNAAFANAAADRATTSFMAGSKVKNAQQEVETSLKTLQVSACKWVDDTKWLTTGFATEAAFWRKVITDAARTEKK